MKLLTDNKTWHSPNPSKRGASLHSVTFHKLRMVRNVRLSRIDPSRTTALRRKFVAEMNRRFARIKRLIRELVVKDDVFGLVGTTPMTLQERQIWRFRTDAGKVTAYRDWLQKEMDAGILTVDPTSGEPWTSSYVRSSYKKGIRRGYTDVSKTKLVDYEGTREEFLREAFGAPETLSKIELISTRVFEELKGITAAMSQQMSRTLAEGLAAGRGPAAIARDLQERVTGLTRKRARVLARTEIISAHAEGQLDAFEKLGIEEVGMMAELSTAGDDRVCTECQDAEADGPYPIKEARGMIPVHPNCRCAWVPIPKPKKEQELGYRLPEALPETPEVKSLLTTEKRLAIETTRLRKAYRAGNRGLRKQLLATKEELRLVRIKIDAVAGVPKPTVVPKPSKVLKPVKAPTLPTPAKTAGTKFATAEDYRQYLVQQVKAAKTPALMKEIKTLSAESKRVWSNWCNTYTSDPNHAKWKRMGREVDAKLKILRKRARVSIQTQRGLLDEVSSKIGKCELLADDEYLKAYQSVADDILSWIPGKRKVTGQFDWVNLEHYSRGHVSNAGSYRVGRQHISMYTKSKQVFAHEFGHHMEYQLKGFLREQTQFFKARTVGEKVKVLPRHTISGIRGKKDKWATYDVYAGRVYEGVAGIGGRAPEVASVGIEHIWLNPYKAATKDPEWFNMIISQLKGIPIK